MPRELARPAWRLGPLSPRELGPYGEFPRLTDREKEAVWAAYRGGRPARTPVTLGTNNRVVLLDSRIDPGDLSYQRIFSDPEAMLIAQLRWQYLCRIRYNVFCDSPTELPDVWETGIDFQNVSDAAFFGAPIHFHASGIPETLPILTDDRKRDILDWNIDQPLEHGFFHEALRFRERVAEVAEGSTFFERPIRLLPYQPLGTDGPLTVALNLRGPAALVDLKRDPQYAHALFDRITTAALIRHEATRAHGNLPLEAQVWLADDSIALLSADQYRTFVLPHHHKWYDTLDPQRKTPRAIHLCGDASRHFQMLHDELGITTFDTGFPVDLAAIRRTLGEEVEILGGVEVPLLAGGTPEQVYARAREILAGGVRVGGRFILREANNLPPGVPWANLAAMYAAALSD